MNIGNRGFTLIEFCVATLIMMVGLLALFQTVNLSMYHNLGNIMKNEAVVVADEQMVLQKVKVVDAATFGALASSASSLTRKTRAGFANYSVVSTVTPMSTASKEVSILVSWKYKKQRFTQSLYSLVINPVR